MVDSPHTPDWARVAELRPQLRQHVHIYPQVFRGEQWYVLHDASTGRHLRFNNPAYAFVGRLDGERTVQEIWHRISAALGEEAPSRDEVVLILAQLLAIDALRSGLPVDTKEFFKRYQHNKRLRRQRAAMSPLAIRIPLFDPDRLLDRVTPWVRPLFSWAVAILWSLMVGFACLLALTNLPLLDAAANRDLLAPANLVSMALLFVTVKLVHEFAHATAVKIWGGEVHEMGITLLVLVPVPYVDASAAWGFRDKYKRVLVGAAGIMAELFVASLALFVWLAVEPGLVRDLAFNAMVVGSVSTLLFNGNPLLRYDGYYVLQDLLEIPNLYTRSSRYYLYLIQRYLFGVRRLASPVSAQGERVWFLCYGAGAFVYRTVIMVTIALFLAEKYLFLGVALGLWALFMQFVMPLYRGVRFLLSHPRLGGRRLRAGTVSAAVVTGLAALLWLVPVSLTTHTEGVVWVPEQAQIFAETEGFVSNLLAQSGSRVDPGTLVLRMHQPTLKARIEVVEARYRELETRRAADHFALRTQSGIAEEEIKAVLAELELLRSRASALEVRSKVSGLLVLPEESALEGRYLRKGELIGYVIDPQRLIVRSIVPQSDIGLVRQRVTRVQVRLAERLGEAFESRILRETPSASAALPSRALGAAGGGEIAIEASDESGRTAAEGLFQIDLALPEHLVASGLGERAYVRFEHGSEPLASQWLRSGRQLLLSRLSL